jgi:ACT domain-containing protein
LALGSVTAQAVRGFTLSIWLYDYRYPSAACAARLLRSIFPLDKHRGNAYNSRHKIIFLQEPIMAKRKTKKTSQVCILTVTGKDKVGIIARIANAMSNANINIIDVSQKIMDEYFVMSLACDIAEAIIDLSNIQKQLQKIAKDMDLNITFQNEKIFKMMHRV